MGCLVGRSGNNTGCGCRIGRTGILCVPRTYYFYSNGGANMHHDHHSLRSVRWYGYDISIGRLQKEELIIFALGLIGKGFDRIVAVRLARMALIYLCAA